MTTTIPEAVMKHHRPGEPFVAGIVEGGWQDLHFEYVHEGDILVWGPNIHGANDGSRDDLPEGWVATCSCGWSSTGHSSEEAADDAATIHEDGLDIDATLIGASIATPPADLAALADARCECNGELLTDDAGDPNCWYCSGEACAKYHPLDGPPCEHDLEERHDDQPCRDVCPRCYDGRLLVEVRKPCCHNVATCRDPSRPHCAWRTDGTADGSRPVTGLIDLVPVRVLDVTAEWSGPVLEVALDRTDFHGAWLWTSTNSGDCHELTPAHVAALADACGRQPDEWVGGWAWLFTEVER